MRYTIEPTNNLHFNDVQVIDAETDREMISIVEKEFPNRESTVERMLPITKEKYKTVGILFWKRTLRTVETKIKVNRWMFFPVITLSGRRLEYEYTCDYLEDDDEESYEDF